jgi:hypothetical protein
MEIIQNNFEVIKCECCGSWLKIDKSDWVEKGCMLTFICPCCMKENAPYFILKDLVVHTNKKSE